MSLNQSNKKRFIVSHTFLYCITFDRWIKGRQLLLMQSLFIRENHSKVLKIQLYNLLIPPRKENQSNGNQWRPTSTATLLKEIRAKTPKSYKGATKNIVNEKTHKNGNRRRICTKATAIRNTDFTSF